MHLTFLILILSVPSIISLRCYVCNSNENKKCVDGSHLATFERICNETIEPYCRKIDQIVNKQSSVVRTCGSKIGLKACYKTAGMDSAHVCSCNEDLCNHAMNWNGQQRFVTIISSMMILAITMLILR